MSDLRSEIITFIFLIFFVCYALERKWEVAVNVKILDQISHQQFYTAIL